MCGIAGVITGDSNVRSELAKRLNNTLTHRGPDEHSIYNDQRAFILHTRLAINGLTDGSQPFTELGPGLILFANAEIYNHKELRKKFSLDLNWTSKNDCAVLLPLYMKLGDGFVDELNGMFSIVIWNKKTETLKIFRDRAGEKPMYYYRNQEMLVFSSELRSLVKAIKPELTWDYVALLNYLRLQFIPEPSTPFREVKKVPAATIFSFSLGGGGVSQQPYWQIGKELDEEATVRTFQSVLEESVSSALISEVPVAIALSGGLDSSVIASVASKSKEIQDLTCFTVGYEHPGPWDETKDAQTFAHSTGLVHERILMTDQDLVRLFPIVCSQRDDPIADISGIAQYHMAEHIAERGFKVLMQGLGADELMWGYPWVRHYALTYSGVDTPLKAKSLMEPNALDFFEQQPFCSWMGANLPKLVPLFCEMESDANSTINSLLPDKNRFESTDFISLIFTTYLRSNGITQSERTGMANSVEVRLPFVNHKLVEQCLGLTNTLNNPTMEPKTLLKLYAEKEMKTFDTTKIKRGFSPPVMNWEKLIRQNFYDRLMDGNLALNNIINRRVLPKLLNQQSDRLASTALRIMLTLEIWWDGVVGD